jgi:hypothetical protein
MAAVCSLYSYKCYSLSHHSLYPTLVPPTILQPLEFIIYSKDRTGQGGTRFLDRATKSDGKGGHRIATGIATRYPMKDIQYEINVLIVWIAISLYIQHVISFCRDYVFITKHDPISTTYCCHYYLIRNSCGEIRWVSAVFRVLVTLFRNTCRP